MIQLYLSGVILVYGVVLSKIIPGKYHWLSNSIFSVALLLIAFNIGLGVSDLGISLNYIPNGVLVAIMASIVILTIALVLATIPLLHQYFLSQSSILKSKTSQIAYQTLFRIPLVTALFEEFIFRGVLLAVFMSYNSNIIAMLYTSIVFGLWHIFPAINGMNANHYDKHSGTGLLRYGFITTNVVATALVGGIFSWLRIISGSILAPWILHWTINAGGVVAVLFAKKQSKKGLR